MIVSTMTQLPGVPDAADAIPGMAYFVGTGPAGKTCGDCTFKGYRRSNGDSEKPRSYNWGGCGMYKKMTGLHGPAISGANRACKYFLDRPKYDP